jgi:hypothetical protein
VNTTTTTPAEARKAEARATAAEQQRAEEPTLLQRVDAAKRHVSKRVGTAAERPGDKSDLIGLEGLSAGITHRERTAAAERLQTTAALAEHRPLTEAEAAAADADRAMLAEAERRAKRKGRWTLVDDRRMSAVDLATLCEQAARAELAAKRQKGQRLTLDQYNDAVADLSAAVAVDALSATAEIEARRLWAMPYGTERADRRLRLAEARAARVGALTPLWRSPYVADAVRGRRRSDDQERALWRSWLRDRAKRVLAAEQKQAEAAEAALTAKQEGRSLTAAERFHSAAATADALADALAAAGRPLTLTEAEAVAALLSGLTHRERAALAGVTQAAIVKRAQRGRDALATRWPDWPAMQADLQAAAASANRADLAAAERAFGPVILHLSAGGTHPLSAERAEQAARALIAFRVTASRRPVGKAEADAPVVRAGLHRAKRAAEAAARAAEQVPRHGTPADVLAWIASVEASADGQRQRVTPAMDTAEAVALPRASAKRQTIHRDRPTLDLSGLPVWPEAERAEVYRTRVSAHRAACRRAGVGCAV